MSPQQVAAARLSCSLKQIQRVRQSLPSVIEMVTPQRYHFAHHKRDCTQLFKHCTRTHTQQCAACLWASAVWGASFTHREIISTVSSFKGQMHQSSAQRSLCYPALLEQRICFILYQRQQEQIDEYLKTGNMETYLLERN